MRFSRRVAVLAGLLAAISSTYVVAQTPYPGKPVRIIVPFPPGGGADVAARIVGQKLGESFGRPTIIDNRAGADGNIGTDVIAKSAPDGHTIGIAAPGPVSIGRRLFPQLPYDPERDLVPVALIYETALVLVVHPTLPVRTVKELVALAKSRPGQLNAALPSTGSIQHLVTEMMRMAAGIRIENVAYKGGAPATTDVAAGQVELAWSVVSIAAPYLQSGRLRGLAVAGSARASLLPDVPTMTEAGFPAVVASNWNGMVAPAGTPKEIVARLNQEIARALNARDTLERFATLGFTPLGGTAEEFAAFLRADTEKWGKVIADAGIRPL